MNENLQNIPQNPDDEIENLDIGETLTKITEKLEAHYENYSKGNYLRIQYLNFLQDLKENRQINKQDIDLQNSLIQERRKFLFLWNSKKEDRTSQLEESKKKSIKNHNQRLIDIAHKFIMLSSNIPYSEKEDKIFNLRAELMDEYPQGLGLATKLSDEKLKNTIKESLRIVKETLQAIRREAKQLIQIRENIFKKYPAKNGGYFTKDQLLIGREKKEAFAIPKAQSHSPLPASLLDKFQ